MYDILQLNDMLVPELQDIAEQLNIPQAKKLEKQELIYKIVDRQAETASESKEPVAEKGKRRRIVKANTAHVTEEAEVMSGGENVVEEPAVEIAKTTHAKRSRKPVKNKEQQPVEGNENTASANVNDTPHEVPPKKEGQKPLLSQILKFIINVDEQQGISLHVRCNDWRVLHNPFP